jgi:hypothetical protein
LSSAFSGWRAPVTLRVLPVLILVVADLETCWPFWLTSEPDIEDEMLREQRTAGAVQ